DLGRRVAIKTLRKSTLLALHARKFDPRRLLDEARHLARVASAFVVPVYAGESHPPWPGSLPSDTPVPYFVMRLPPGETLKRRLRARWRLGDADVIGSRRHLASGLEEAHAAGLVHGDLKPDNVWLESTRAGDQALMLDFGSAEWSDDPYLTALLGAQPHTRAYGSPAQQVK